MPINISFPQSQEILDKWSNGRLEGIDAARGGGALLDGEWRLAELEALCVEIRHFVDDGVFMSQSNYTAAKLNL